MEPNLQLIRRELQIGFQSPTLKLETDALEPKWPAARLLQIVTC
jgi:hypothetical protein